MQYRAEIDGLRALAIIPVVLYHAGVTGFAGGFVGVDVFFVISGFLITSLLIAQLEKGAMSLREFYIRRAKRILPALFTVMLCSIPLAMLFMDDTQFRLFAHSSIATMLFVSNLFYGAIYDYFAPLSELNPLLHTWSLAVEEQYYLLFPLLLAALWKRGITIVVAVIATLTVLSLWWSEHASATAPDFNFYFTLTRIWELLVGSLLALWVAKKGLYSSNVLSMLGLGVLILSFVFFNASIAHPSVMTLIPVLATVAIIVSADTDTFVHRMLSTKLLVGIGLISYSLYLWHQPVFAFAHLSQHTSGLGVPLTDFNAVQILFLVMITIALSYVTWRYIETPFRRRDYSVTCKVPHSYVAALCAMVILVVPLAQFTPSVSMSQNISFIQMKTWFSDVYEDECHIQSNAIAAHSEDCVSEQSSILVWGDSHAASLVTGIRQINQATQIAQLTQAGCPPFIHTPVLLFKPNCNAINQDVLDLITYSDFQVIVLHAAWFHVHYPLSYQDIATHLNDVITHLKIISPRSDIVVVGAVPRWRHDQRYHRIETSRDTVHFSTSATLFDDLNATLSVAVSAQEATFVDPTKVLCPAYAKDNSCIVAADKTFTDTINPVMFDDIPDINTSQPVGTYVDHAHLSRVGASLLAQDVLTVIADKRAAAIAQQSLN